MEEVNNLEYNSDRSDEKLHLSVVSDSDFIEHQLEDEYGYKFCVKLPSDAKDITVISDENDNIKVGFKTKFDGKRYLQTYIDFQSLSLNRKNYEFTKCSYLL